MRIDLRSDWPTKWDLLKKINKEGREKGRNGEREEGKKRGREEARKGEEKGELKLSSADSLGPSVQVIIFTWCMLTATHVDTVQYAGVIRACSPQGPVWIHFWGWSEAPWKEWSLWYRDYKILFMWGNSMHCHSNLGPLPTDFLDKYTSSVP